MSRKTHTIKHELITELVAVRRRILAAAVALSPEQQDVALTTGWSIKDLLAHLHNWDCISREAAVAIAAGRLPPFYARRQRDQSDDSAALADQVRVADFATLLDTVTDSHHRLVKTLSAIPAVEFDRDTGVRFMGYTVTIAGFLQAHIDDEKSQAVWCYRSGVARRSSELPAPVADPAA